MRSALCPRLILLALGASGALYARSARAADDNAPSVEASNSDAAAAQALFTEGRSLASSGDYEPACKKFEASLKLRTGIGTRFHLADCWEHLGRNASAYRLFLATAEAARVSGQAERAQVAQSHAQRLEPLLARLAVELETDEPDVAVSVDQERLERGAWASWPVDPGPHTIGVTAPGKLPWSNGIEVAPGASLVVHVPTLESVPHEVPAPPKLVPPGPRAPQLSAPVSHRAAPPTQPAVPSVLVLGLAAVGVSGFVAGTVFGLHYQSLDEHAIAICPSGNGCTAEQVSAHDSLVADARKSANLALVGFSVGTLAFIGATALYLHQSSPPVSSSGWAVEPTVSADGSWGASARGRF